MIRIAARTYSLSTVDMPGSGEQSDKNGVGTQHFGPSAPWQGRVGLPCSGVVQYDRLFADGSMRGSLVTSSASMSIRAAPVTSTLLNVSPHGRPDRSCRGEQYIF